MHIFISPLFVVLRQPEIELLTFQVGMLYCDSDRVS